MKKIIIATLLLALVVLTGCTGNVNSSKADVVGQITNERGAAVIGATIAVKDNTESTAVTDIRGKYSIKAEKGDTLLFSLTDTTTFLEKMVVGNDKVVNVVLVDDNEELEIVGKIVDKSGDFIAGATVTVKDTPTSTTTDDEGFYSIRVQKGKTLVFSLSGKEPLEEKVIGNTIVMNIIL